MTLFVYFKLDQGYLPRRHQQQNLCPNLEQRIATGDLLFRGLCTFILTVALQALISEAVSLISKLNLRPDLNRYLDEKKADPLPNLDNLLYYDIKGGITLFAPDYKPEDPDELERLMGSAEVFRSFTLATVK